MSILNYILFNMSGVRKQDLEPRLKKVRNIFCKWSTFFKNIGMSSDYNHICLCLKKVYSAVTLIFFDISPLLSSIIQIWLFSRQRLVMTKTNLKLKRNIIRKNLFATYLKYETQEAFRIDSANKISLLRHFYRAWLWFEILQFVKFISFKIKKVQEI